MNENVIIDKLASLSYLVEGFLLEDETGYYIKSDSGSEYVTDILDRFKGKEVRLVLVDLLEAETLGSMIQE